MAFVFMVGVRYDWGSEGVRSPYESRVTIPYCVERVDSLLGVISLIEISRAVALSYVSVSRD